MKHLAIGAIGAALLLSWAPQATAQIHLKFSDDTAPSLIPGDNRKANRDRFRACYEHFAIEGKTSHRPLKPAHGSKPTDPRHCIVVDDDADADGETVPFAATHGKNPKRR